MARIVSDDCSLTSTLIRRSKRVFDADLPLEVLLLAQDSILDFVAVTLAAVDESVGVIAASSVEDCVHVSGTTLIGRGRRAAAGQAALVNGATAHALDYDDTNIGFLGHQTVPVLAAILATAELAGCDGDSLLRAFVAGVEAECLLAELIGPSHYALGWHSTATLGTFGAAVACGLLAGQSLDTLASTVGLAAIQASGMQLSFGTMAKPLQVGIAAQSGVRAAQWASSGMTGPPSALDGPTGFVALHSSGQIDRTGIDIDRWRIVDVVFKFHAACFLTHSSIDAVRRILDESEIASEEIASIVATVSTTAAEVCDRPTALTGLDSKFSIQANVARAVVGIDTADPETFARNADIGRLAPLAAATTVVPSAASGLTAATVTITLHDGRSYSQCVESNNPEPVAAIRRDRLVEKFSGLTLGKIPLDRAEELKKTILHDLPGLTSVHQLMGALSRPLDKEVKNI
ncbi:MAG TPA: MmgE/PrpD family protein [Tepidiformaceae bacterium]